MQCVWVFKDASVWQSDQVCAVFCLLLHSGDAGKVSFIGSVRPIRWCPATWLFSLVRPSLEWIQVRSVQETPKTVHTIAITLGCPSESDDRSQWLKTPHTFVRGYGKIKMVLTSRFSPHWLESIGRCHVGCRCWLSWTVWTTVMAGVACPWVWSWWEYFGR